MSEVSVDEIPSLEDFPLWMEEHAGITIDSTHIEHYNTARMRMQEQLEKSSFWDLVCRRIIESDDEYFGEHGTELLKERRAPKIGTKPGDSFLEKVYRQNVIDNTGFPSEPETRWVTPDNWFSKIDDIVRTTVVVRYLDGIEYLAARLVAACSEESTLGANCKYLAKLEGYYAAHLYFGMEFEIPGMKWDSQRVMSQVEIQITTQIKEVIKELIHPHYAEERLRRHSEEERWQWRYERPEFARNYLGHIIQYVEGVMVGIRRRNK